MLSMLTIQSSQQLCAETQTNSEGFIHAIRQAANGSLLSIDYWGKHRVLSLATKSVLYEADIKSLFFASANGDTFVQSYFYIDDDTIGIVGDVRIYTYRFE